MSIKDNENILKLLNPTMEYKEQVMNYRKVFLENGESFDGCSGLEECETYEKWIEQLQIEAICVDEKIEEKELEQNYYNMQENLEKKIIAQIYI